MPDDGVNRYRADGASLTVAGREAQAGTRGLVADSGTIAMWTLISRVTGFARVMMAAAVLGPTYFGNLFQTIVVLPAVLYALLGGSLTSSILVPRLVGWVDTRDQDSIRRFANDFLGVSMVVLGLIVIVSVVCGPLILMATTAAVADPAIRAQQHAVGLWLLALVLPELVLYSVASVGMAVQNARGQFALAAAAPATENLMSIAVLGASAAFFGTGHELGDIATSQLVLLGIGTTAGLAIHAGVQWYGAYRTGTVLLPAAGWRNSEIRRMVRLAFTSSGYTALYNLMFICAVIVAGRIPGGAIAFQTGFAFLLLPVALGAAPLAAAQLPRLSRSFNEGDLRTFGASFERALALTRFIALPAGLLLFAVSAVVARAMAFGQMATEDGVAMLAACIGGLGIGVLGEAEIAVATSASYARREAGAPLRAQILRSVLAFSGMALAIILARGIGLLWTVSLSLSLANLASAAYLRRSVLRASSQRTTNDVRALSGDILASLIAVAPCVLVDVWGGGYATGRYHQVALLLVLLVVFFSTYLGVQWVRRSSELDALVQEIVMRRAQAPPKKAS